MAAGLEVPLEGGPVELVGVLDVDREGQGIVPRRLPGWTRPQVPDLFMETMVRMPSGVRLRFATDSTSVELDVLVTHLRLVPDPVRPSWFDLRVDGVPAGAESTTVGPAVGIRSLDPGTITFEDGGPTTIRFEGLPPGPKDVEVWLPQGAVVELRALRIDDGSTASPAAVDDRPRWVHYGSSISHAMEASSPTATWPAVAADLAGHHLTSVALAGQCQLDPFLARTIRDLPADVITLKVGINLVNGATMVDRTFAPAVHGFLDTIREGQPDTPIVLVSPIFCPCAEDRPGPTVPGPDGRFRTIPGLEDVRATGLTLTKVRTVLRDVVELRRSLGDANLAYVDGLGLFGPDDAGDLPDDLHPNAAGQRRMGERAATLVFGAGGALDGLEAARG